MMPDCDSVKFYVLSFKKYMLLSLLFEHLAVVADIPLLDSYP